MSIQHLIFLSAGGTSLWSTDGTTVTFLADSTTTPAFAGTDPFYSSIGTAVVGTNLYFTMADSSGTTSAIWRYDGTNVAQITSSSDYVFNQPDSSNATAPSPMTSFGGNLVFSQATLASNTNSSYDTATLAIYNTTTQAITQPATPNGGYDPSDFVTLNNVLYFEATDSGTGALAIYSYDGTAVTEIYNLHPTYTFDLGGGPQSVTAAGAVDGPLAVFNSHIYFGSGQQTVYELTGTTSLSNSATNEAGAAEYLYSGAGGSDLIVSNSHLFFLSNNNGIYSLSTTNALTQVLTSIGAQSFTPVAYNNELYFFSTDPNDQSSNLYTSTGGAATKVVSNYSGSNLEVIGSTLYDNDGGTGLGTIANTTKGELSIPGNATGTPLAVVPFAATSYLACFVQGTRISTEMGSVAVEELVPGIRALTLDGPMEIVWIGHRRTRCAGHPRPWDVMPVRVAAGAFGPGLPTRDLRLSPDHAVFADGHLIPVRYLMNGATIRQEPVAEITYWHVELARHAVLLAENLPAESYLDTGNRSAFANGGDAAMLHPDFARAIWGAQGCARLITDGAVLESVRSVLAEGAARCGWRVTDAPALVLDVDGRRCALDGDGTALTAALPRGAKRAVLRSRCFVPAEHGLDADTRRLGVGITALELDGSTVALNDPRLQDGWHPAEPGLRWTTGQAALAVAGATRLTVRIARIGRYWIEPPGQTIRRAA